MTSCTRSMIPISNRTGLRLQMGILSFVGQEVRNDKIHGACLLRWASKRARRVCHSTLAAETLAATGALDSQAGLRFRLSELDFYPRSVMLTDCRSLFDHVYSMTGSTAEMLLPDVRELREAVMPWRSALSEITRTSSLNSGGVMHVCNSRIISKNHHAGTKFST